MVWWQDQLSRDGCDVHASARAVANIRLLVSGLAMRGRDTGGACSRFGCGAESMDTRGWETKSPALSNSAALHTKNTPRRLLT